MAREVVIPLRYVKDMHGVAGRNDHSTPKGDLRGWGRDVNGRVPNMGRFQAGGRTISHEGPWRSFDVKRDGPTTKK